MAIIEKIGDVFKVNTTTSGAAFLPAVTALRNGGYVVVWTIGGGTANSDVAAQIYDANDFRSGGEFLVNNITNNGQFAPDVTTLNDGSFVVTWIHEFSLTDQDIKAKRFSEAGVAIGTGFEYNVAATTANEGFPHIAAQTGSTNYVVTWTLGNVVDFVQHDVNHAILSGPGPVDVAGAGVEGESDIASLRNGSYVTAFVQDNHIFERRLIDGVTPAQKADDDFWGSVSRNPSVAALEGGGYVVVWTQGDGNAAPAGTPPFPRVMGRRYDEFGNKVGFFSPVNPSQTDNTGPVVHGLVGGGFILVWDDGALGLRGIVYDKNNVAIDQVFQLTPQGTGGSFGDIGVTQKVDGDIVVTWSGNNGTSIDAQVIRAFNIVDGTNGNDQLATALSGAVSNLHPGFQANDWIRGLDGNDYLQGFGGARDILDGGNGIDTATYIDSQGPVSANLLVPAFNNGDAIGDQYISIENLEGSFFGDQLAGNNGANRIWGLDGQDVIEGNGGDDWLVGNANNDDMDGGPGLDTARFFGTRAQYTVTPAGNGWQVAGPDGTDTVTHVELLQFDDLSMNVNRTAIAAITDHNVNTNAWSRMSDWLAATDADGDAITQFQFYDAGSSPDSGYFYTPTNTHVAADTYLTVDAADINSMWVRGGNAAWVGSYANNYEHMWVRAFDSAEWGAWEDFWLVTHHNTAPVVTMPDINVGINGWASVRNSIASSDADGNSIMTYQFYDAGSSPNSAHLWTLAHTDELADNYITVSAADLATTWVHGGDAAWLNGFTYNNELMWVRGFDGTEWSAWDAFWVVTH